MLVHLERPALPLVCSLSSVLLALCCSAVHSGCVWSHGVLLACLFVLQAWALVVAVVVSCSVTPLCHASEEVVFLVTNVLLAFYNL
jgi:hypothetical protein